MFFVRISLKPYISYSDPIEIRLWVHHQVEQPEKNKVWALDHLDPMWGQGHFATWRRWCWTLSRWVGNRGNHQIHQCVAKFPMTFHGKIWKVSTTDFIWFYCILSSSWKCSVRMLFWMQLNAMHLDKCLQCTACNNLVRYVALTSLKHCIKRYKKVSSRLQDSTDVTWCDMMRLQWDAKCGLIHDKGWLGCHRASSAACQLHMVGIRLCLRGCVELTHQGQIVQLRLFKFPTFNLHIFHHFKRAWRTCRT